MKKYFWNVLIGIDQLANAVLLGDPDETMSSRMGKSLRAKEKCFLCKYICWLLDKIDPKHCRDAIEEDEGKDGL